MDIRGQRFTIPLDEEPTPSRLPATSPFDFVQDVQERSTVRPADPPSSATASSTTGFPQHRKRTRVSTFKQQRGGHATPAAAVRLTSEDTPVAQHGKAGPPPPPPTASFEDVERRQIDQENRQRLADMTDAEIAEEREALMAQLDPAVIARLLRRANLDDGRGDTGAEATRNERGDLDGGAGEAKPEIEANSEAEKPPLTAGSIATPIPRPDGRPVTAPKSVQFVEDAEESTSRRPAAAAATSSPKHDSIHFPTPAPLPDLDPSDPDFLTTLHSKYFPDLPQDPSKLAWMAPLPSPGSTTDRESSYHPSHSSIHPSAVRFSFRGALLPPSIARAMPANRGLHHHADAPEAAGYTIAELAHLARSALPAQRCIAFQTLGRLLYRLGRGEFGTEGGGKSRGEKASDTSDDVDGQDKNTTSTTDPEPHRPVTDADASTLCAGLWAEMDKCKVLAILEAAGATTSGHVGSRAYATEALWLWRKGGGRATRAV